MTQKDATVNHCHHLQIFKSSYPLLKTSGWHQKARNTRQQWAAMSIHFITISLRVNIKGCQSVTSGRGKLKDPQNWPCSIWSVSNPLISRNSVALDNFAPNPSLVCYGSKPWHPSVHMKQIKIARFYRSAYPRNMECIWHHKCGIIGFTLRQWKVAGKFPHEMEMCIDWPLIGIGKSLNLVNFRGQSQCQCLELAHPRQFHGGKLLQHRCSSQRLVVDQNAPGIQEKGIPVLGHFGAWLGPGDLTSLIFDDHVGGWISGQKMTKAIWKPRLRHGPQAIRLQALRSYPSLSQQFCHRCSEGQDTGGFGFNLDTLARSASHWQKCISEYFKYVLGNSWHVWNPDQTLLSLCQHEDRSSKGPERWTPDCKLLVRSMFTCEPWWMSLDYAGYPGISQDSDDSNDSEIAEHRKVGFISLHQVWVSMWIAHNSMDCRMNPAAVPSDQLVLLRATAEGAVGDAVDLLNERRLKPAWNGLEGLSLKIVAILNYN